MFYVNVLLILSTGVLDSEKTLFLQFNNTIVLVADIYHSIAIEPKDCFGNATAIDRSKLDVEIRKVNIDECVFCVCFNHLDLQNGPSGPQINPEFFADQNAVSKYELFLKVEGVGYYAGRVKYNNWIVGPQWFTLISLTSKI